MKLSDEIGCREFDQGAETLGELVQATGYGRAWVARYAKEQIASGKWEQVWKRTNGKPAPAYRRKKKRN